MGIEKILSELDSVDQKLKDSLKDANKKFPLASLERDCGGCLGTQMCNKIPVDLKN